MMTSTNHPRATSPAFAIEVGDGDRSAKPTQEQKHRPTSDGKRKRILLADDDPDMRELLKWSLIHEGYEVDTAVDGIHLCSDLAAHLTHPDSEPIDLVISDIRMPGVTGIEVVRGMRDLKNFPPTILITAFGDEEIHREADEIDVLLMDKPFEIDDLVASVREILE